MNSKMSERAALLATINPLSQGAGAAASGWVSVRDVHRLMALVQTGVLGASATVDAKLQQAQDGAGTGAKDITGCAITQIVKASGDNKQAMIDCDVHGMDANNGFSYVQLTITVGTAASLVAGSLWGFNTGFEPASALNQAGVVQVAGT